mmetsp:Transcript_81137/g.241766  ORF Transcript_81137/g.241766 Transcript_81137/m.241766 type:complete len:202 (+) Transcript_81137:314-919(+)
MLPLRHLRKAAAVKRRPAAPASRPRREAAPQLTTLLALSQNGRSTGSPCPRTPPAGVCGTGSPCARVPPSLVVAIPGARSSKSLAIAAGTSASTPPAVTRRRSLSCVLVAPPRARAPSAARAMAETGRSRAAQALSLTFTMTRRRKRSLASRRSASRSEVGTPACKHPPGPGLAAERPEAAGDAHPPTPSAMDAADSGPPP